MQSIIESMLVPYSVLLWKTHVEVGYSYIQELIDFPTKSSLYSNYMGRTPINQLLGKVCNLEFLGQIIKMCYLLCKRLHLHAYKIHRTSKYFIV